MAKCDCGICRVCTEYQNEQPSAESAGYGTVAKITMSKFAEDAIRLMIEYRDTHGYEEEYAIGLAVRDMCDPAAQIIVVP